MINSTNNTSPFNNSVETGLRLLTVLNQSYPESFDVTKILYFDHIIVHSGDVDENFPSLHPSVPYRRGELLVRKPIIQAGLNLLASRGLIDIIYSSKGIEYSASEYSTPFVESLSSPYAKQLINRAEWIQNNYIAYSIDELHLLLSDFNHTFDLEILD